MRTDLRPRRLRKDSKADFLPPDMEGEFATLTRRMTAEARNLCRVARLEATGRLYVLVRTQ